MLAVKLHAWQHACVRACTSFVELYTISFLAECLLIVIQSCLCNGVKTVKCFSRSTIQTESDVQQQSFAFYQLQTFSLVSKGLPAVDSLNLSLIQGWLYSLPVILPCTQSTHTHAAARALYCRKLFTLQLLAAVTLPCAWQSTTKQHDRQSV